MRLASYHDTEDLKFVGEQPLWSKGIIFFFAMQLGEERDGERACCECIEYLIGLPFRPTLQDLPRNYAILSVLHPLE